jgi:hypothetical protein
MKVLEKDQRDRIEDKVREYLKSELKENPRLGVILMDPENLEHVVRIGGSILSAKWELGPPPGSFVQAVVDNDLMGAFSRADHINKEFIGFYCKLVYNTSYIY